MAKWVHIIDDTPCDSEVAFPISGDIQRGLAVCDEHDRRVKPAQPEKPEDTGITIEIIHGRDPDSSCELTVFLNGVRVENFVETDLDPGRGWERGDWESYKQSSLSSGTPAYIAALEAEFDAFGDSTYIEGTRKEWVEGVADAFLRVSTHAQGWAWSDDTDLWEPDCDVLSREFIEFCKDNYFYEPRLVHVRPPEDTGEMYSDHWFVDFDGIAVDWTARQFYNVPQPPVAKDSIDAPLIFPWPDEYPLPYVEFKEVED